MTSEAPASIDVNKATVREVVDKIWNGADLASVDRLYDPKFTFYQEGGGVMHGPDGIKEWVQVIHGAFPDIDYKVEAQYAEGEKVATRYSATGTHTGDFRGMPPTGKPIALTGHMIYRLVDGKVVEGWGYWDTLGLLQELGVLPPMGPPRG
jgi:steroid delta-isomerase-like uncharacterized protein